MKRIIAYLTIIVFTSLYIICSHAGLMKKVSAYKYQTNSILGSDKLRYGDLFGISYLRDYKKERDTDSLQVPVDKINCSEKINLCVVHDSYLGEDFLKSKEQLGCVENLYNIEYPWWRNKTFPPVHIDTSKKNILLLEIVERSLSLLDSSNIRNFISFDGGKQIQGNPAISYVKNIKNILFNPDVDKNLEYVVFDTKLFTPFKELKASINHKIFNRTAPEVMVSSNKKYLFLSETLASVTTEIPDTTINRLVDLLNKAYVYYKEKGFKEVYISIIPNPISIIAPESQSYNNLIPRIQSHKELKMPVVDIYSVFKSAGVQIYYSSDTHWNKNGFQLWLNKWNSVLALQYKLF